MKDKPKELQIIKTVGENGEEIELKLLDIVSVNDLDYALLLPADEDEEDEDAEVVLMRLNHEGDEYSFEVIEDDKEFEEVAKILSDDGTCSCGDDCGDDCDCGCHHHH